MSTHYDDEAQVEDLRRWWKENWLALAIGLGLGLGAIFGWEYYQQRLDQTRAEASQLFEALKQAAAERKTDEASAIGDRLIAEFDDTPYAVAGALKLAQVAVDGNRLDIARQRLEWASAHTDDVALRPLIQLRLARVLWQQGKAAEAQALLDAPDASYAVLYEELRGDIRWAEGDRPGALAAYQKALATLGDATPGTPNAPLAIEIRKKIDDLADVATVSP